MADAERTIDFEAEGQRKKTTDELLNRFAYAEAFRSQYDDKAEEWYKLYVGYREPLTEEQEGRSNLHIPRTYEEVDTLRARLVKSFFTTRPYIELLPMPSGASQEIVQANEQKAELAGAFIDMQLEKNAIARKFYDFVTSLLIFPAAIMAVGWRLSKRQVKRRVPVEVPILSELLKTMGKSGALGYRIEKTEVVEWDDNEVSNVDWSDFWPDPRGCDLDSCRFVFHREWMTREALESHLNLLEQLGTGDVYPLDFDSLRTEGQALEEGKWSRLAAVGEAPENGLGDIENWPDGALYEILHYWEDDRHAIIVNRQSLAYDGPNPYWRHMKKPFVVACYEPLPNMFYGMSAVQLLEHLQHELNTTRNQRIDNVSFVLNRMLKVKRSADIDEAELVMRPRGVIYVDAPDDVTPFEMPDVTSSSYNEERIIREDMENTVGTPAVVRGAQPSRRETATEVVTKSSNASIRFDVKIMLFEVLGIKRLAQLMDMNNQQFVDGPRIVKVMGKGDDAGWLRVNPEDLIGEYDYRPSGSNADPVANKEVRRQQLTAAWQMVMQNPYIDKYEWTKEWVRTFDLRNPDKMVLSREDVMQAAAMLQQGQGQVAATTGAAAPAGSPFAP